MMKIFRSKKTILAITSTCLFVLGQTGYASTPDASIRPNVIVILADDLGYADVGFHEPVADSVTTPNLDRLAASGVSFTNGYATSPICSCSRLGLSTGRYQQRWGAYYYGDGGLPKDEYTIAEMMQDAGYRTMKVGKTHLNNGPKEHPMKHGFDQFLGFIHHSWDYFLLSQKDVDAYERKSPGSHRKARYIPFGPLTRDHGKKESFEDTTTTEVFGEESIQFIKDESEKPFYLQLEFNAVHTALTRAPEAMRGKYGVPERPFDRDAELWEYPHWDPIAQPDNREWHQQTSHLKISDPYGRKIYLAHLELMDSMIGQIIDALEAKGVADNTLIFFSSDNGGSDQSYANNGLVNAYKYCLMDGGTRVPMLVSWPQQIKGNQTIDALVTHRDLFPSLSQITGVAPKNPLDGKSLLPLIAGDVNELHTEAVYWDSGPTRNNWVVREGDWKLVFSAKPKIYNAYELDEKGLVKPEFRKVHVDKGFLLFNLAKDPGETQNLSAQLPERVERMKALHAQWRAEMGEPIKGRFVK